MGKTVAFSFSTEFEDSSAEEIFTFEKLGINEDMDDEAVMKVIEELCQAWIWSKLNISHSIVITED